MNYKFITFIFILFYSMFTYADTILFVDLNDNPLEIRAAKQAAKRSGDKLIVYPPKGEKFNKKKALEVIGRGNYKVLALSGHNGGGSFSGDRGQRLNKNEIDKEINKSNKSKTNVDTLLLIGCNTGNRQQIYEWRNVFPKLKIVAGYDGFAFLGHDPRGHTYIKDIIKKRKKILTISKEKRLKKELSSLRNLSELELGLYVQTSICNNCTESKTEQEFYFRPKEKTKKGKFQPFISENCKKPIKKLGKYKKIFLEFFSGETELSAHRQNEELKETYLYLTKNEHCIREFIDNNPTSAFESFYPDAVLMLRFYSKVKENFIVEYKHSLNQFSDQLSNLSFEEYIENYNEELNYITQSHKRYATYLNSPETFLKHADMKIENTKDEMDKLEKKSGKDLSKIYNDLLASQVNYDEIDTLIAKQSLDIQEFDRLDTIVNTAEYFKGLTKKERLKHIKMSKELLSDSLKGLEKQKSKPSKSNFSKLKKLAEEVKILNKKTSRRDIAELAHNLYALPEWTLGRSRASTLERFGVLINSGLYQLSNDIIPFSWHDTYKDRKKNVMRPEPVLEEFYQRQNLFNEETDDFF